MAAGASTCNQNTALIWLKAIGMLFYVLLASLIVFLVFKYLTWNWGIISLFVTVLVFTLIFFDRDYLKFGLFVLFTLYLATDFPVGIYRLLGSKEVIAVIRNSAILTFLLDGPNLRVVWSVVLGFIGALLVTLIPILFFSLISGVFILALHRIEGVSWWDATKYITSLLLGINLPFIVVENGQA
ncbi:MAG: hypothetical protein HYR94_24475, partial [Chloroflexi bacterium]|nr:hypothetical protein [Chloroflexota bacterium]